MCKCVLILLLLMFGKVIAGIHQAQQYELYIPFNDLLKRISNIGQYRDKQRTCYNPAILDRFGINSHRMLSFKKLLDLSRHSSFLKGEFEPVPYLICVLKSNKLDGPYLESGEILVFVNYH